jgi:hypothetical protein
MSASQQESTSRSEPDTPGAANDRGGSASTGGTGGSKPPDDRTPMPPVDDGIPTTKLFTQNLDDAELLLSHAAQVGRFPLEAPGSKESLKQWVIDGVLNARIAVEGNKLTKGIASDFWASFADLSHITSPVTAATLRTPDKRWFSGLDLMVIALIVLLIPLSVFLFVNTSVANQVSDLIKEQNSTALKLWSQAQFSRNTTGGVMPPGDATAASANDERARALQNRAYGVVTQAPAGVARLTEDDFFSEVVDFARKSFWLRETSIRLNRFLPLGLNIDEEPVGFDEQNVQPWTKFRLSPLNVSPTIDDIGKIRAEAIKQISMYQPIRNFAQSSLKMNNIVYGEITAYFLPALYALLGAALYALRHYTKMVQIRAYLKTSANTARYFIALIVGTVIGLFGSLLPESLALSPLAVAFLMGYAVEAFFSRLDSFIARVTGDEATRPAPAADVPSARTKAA